jgi:hypothetical protein
MAVGGKIVEQMTQSKPTWSLTQILFPVFFLNTDWPNPYDYIPAQLSS